MFLRVNDLTLLVAFGGLKGKPRRQGIVRATARKAVGIDHVKICGTASPNFLGAYCSDLPCLLASVAFDFLRFGRITAFNPKFGLWIRIANNNDELGMISDELKLLKMLRRHA